MAKSSASDELLMNSSLYREFLAEREEILRHKWLESEQVGIDVGFEEALTGGIHPCLTRIGYKYWPV